MTEAEWRLEALERVRTGCFHLGSCLNALYASRRALQCANLGAASRFIQLVIDELHEPQRKLEGQRQIIERLGMGDYEAFRKAIDSAPKDLPVEAFFDKP